MAKLISQLNLPTLIAILAMNGWSIGTTQQRTAELSDEQRTALRQLSQLYQSLNEFEDRQKITVQSLSKVLDTQTEELQNQTRMLQNQQQMLETLKRQESHQ